MSDGKFSPEVLAVENEAGQRPIPSAWRPAFREIVNAFIRQDYRLKVGVVGVEPISAETAEQIQNYIRDYGATLIALQEEAWDSSVCIWSRGHWDVLVDLWTKEEGSSDLVLSARVTRINAGFLIKIQMVYVP